MVAAQVAPAYSLAVMATLDDLVFNRILKDKKVRYSNGQDYAFARKLDDHTYGRDEELAINVISPFHEHAGSEATLQSQNMGKSELLVLMPDDGKLMPDLLMLKRTEKYFNQNYSLAQQESRKCILTEKKAQNAERENSLLQRVQDLLGKAPIVMYGTVTDSNEAKAQTRIFKAFEALIGRAYPNLSILRELLYNANDIPKYVRQSEQGILDDSVSKMSEAETEVFSYITRCDKAGERVSLQKTLEGFSHKPYGWPDAATLCLLAKLCARGKVELRMEGRVLEDAAEMTRALQNSKEYTRVLLT